MVFLGYVCPKTAKVTCNDVTELKVTTSQKFSEGKCPTSNPLFESCMNINLYNFCIMRPICGVLLSGSGSRDHTVIYCNLVKYEN